MTSRLQSVSSDQAEKLISLFLADHYSGVLATAGLSDEPHGAVIYYLPEPDYSLYFVTKEETQKYKNIQVNNRVAFVIYDEKSQTTLQLHGVVHIVDDLEKKRETIRNMTNSSVALSGTLLPPAYKVAAGEYVVLQLVPRLIQLTRYGHSDKSENIHESLVFES